MTKTPATPSKESHQNAKTLGAYYTSKPVADFLVRWAIRSSLDTVLDPSFGGGIFLHAASERLQELGGNPCDQVFGIELNPKVHGDIGTKLSQEASVDTANLWLRDFFDVEPLPINQVSVAVGNPPFIRYQRFTAEVRERALSKAADRGVKLTQLSSSWAPFVVHAVAMLRKNGRIAFVLPAELGYAKYAVPVLEHLINSFGRITLLTFREKLFPHLSEDTLLLLAEQKGSRSDTILHRDLKSADTLSKMSLSRTYKIHRTKRIEVDPLIQKTQRLIEYLLPKKTRQLYRELKASGSTVRLGDVIDVGIGYVTGANDFFHLSPGNALRFEIPLEFLRPAVRRGRAFNGLRFTDSDWQRAVSTGDAGYLLFISGQSDLPDGIQEYLRIGRESGVSNAFKCRTRTPWYSVPHVAKPDAFLSYMSGATPRLVSNEAGAVAPNTLHILRFKDKGAYTANAIASLWLSSLTRLSVEIEGHPLGGGMLKLEPSEAENSLLAFSQNTNGQLNNLYDELDGLMRSGREGLACELADRRILNDSLGLSRTDCKLLRDGAYILMNRRYRREK